MEIYELIENEGSVTIIGEDDMFNNACEMIEVHMNSKDKCFNVKEILECQKKSSFLGTFTYDTALLTLSEIFVRMLINGQIYYYGKEEEQYINSKELFFDEKGIDYLLNELIKLRDDPANERAIYDEYTVGEEEKDTYLLEIINMYINFLSKELVK